MPKKTNSRNKRSSSNNDDQQEGLQSPDPPPPPPAPLVKLIQKNSRVLQYFQSLQANLDYDVAKWKNRARHHEAKSLEWKEKFEELQQIMQTTNNNNYASIHDQSRPLLELPESKRLKSAPPNIEVKPKRNETKDPDDWMELVSSSSEEENEEEEKEKREQVSFNPSSNVLKLMASSSEDDEDSVGLLESAFSAKPPTILTTTLESNNRWKQESLRNSMKHLKVAKVYLDQLGIQLVTKSAIEESAIGEEEKNRKKDDGDGISSEEGFVLKRRSDQEVIIDLLQVIKAMVRLRVVHDANTYYPFMTDELLPCFSIGSSESAASLNTDEEAHPPSHPAIEGFQAVSKALCLMDAYCPIIDTIRGDEHFSHSVDDWYEEIAIGMKDRHCMVRSMIQSLEGEICQQWAVQDRSTRLVTTSIHFQKATSGERKDNGLISFGSKNLTRMAALCERAFLAKLICTIHLFRQDHKSAFQFLWSYLLTTTVSLNLERDDENPAKFPPVQSLCVLESIFKCEGHDGTKTNLLSLMHNTCPTVSKYISRVANLVVSVTACIHKIRNTSSDDRITDVATVELKAFERLESFHQITNLEEYSNQVSDWIEQLLQVPNEEWDDKGTILSLLLVTLFVLLGSIDEIDGVFSKELSDFCSNIDGRIKKHHLLLACVKAKGQLEIRLMDSYRQLVTTPFKAASTGKSTWAYTADLWKLLQSNRPLNSIKMDLALTTLSCCRDLADGETALRVIRWVILNTTKDMAKGISFTKMLDAVESIGRLTTIRVINLERRSDRMKAFLSQSIHQGVLVMKAVSDIDNPKEENKLPRENTCNDFYYAIDGQGRPAEVEKRLSQLIAKSNYHDLSALVESHWRPNDLKPFDSEAPDALTLTRISPSEKACALSHIASWYGVAQSLNWQFAERSIKDKSLFRCSGEIYKRFHISGYARGPALFPENQGMKPSPVCVILEDDAILVERFVDRLDALLEELPRDFHFCSLGYSRPKTAPLVPFSSQIAIPTSIWYLTGYILSLEGANYLFDNLPVRGPVDSWIGLKMFSNWDNMFGHAMGVGMVQRPGTETTISHKDLRSLFKFRAFAAQIPLCSQKVGQQNVSNIGRRNWRQRDTDITYSGNL